MGLFSWLRKKQKEAQTPDESLVAYSPEVKVTTSDIAKIVEDAYVTDNLVPIFKKRVLVSNGTITVYIQPSGNIYSESGVDQSFVKQVIDCTSEEEIRVLFQIPEPAPEPKLIKDNFMDDPEEDEKLSNDLPEMIESGEFEEKDGAIYLKGIDLSIPKVLAREMRKAAEEETPDRFNALKNFWYWCALNPDPKAREDTFPFLVKAGFKITPNGNFLARRMVQKVSKAVQNQGLTEFISAQWIKVKKSKKSPKNFYVFPLSAGGWEVRKIIDGKQEDISLGILNDLYQNLTSIEDNEYTDMYTRTMKIVIGKEVRMSRDKCNSDPSQTCSRGLHVAAYGYNISGNGDTVILVTVNPMNVVAVPAEYGAAKMRVCAYMPLAVVENDNEALAILQDKDTIDLEDMYFSDQLDNLEEMAKNSGATETKINVIDNKKIVKVIINKLEEAKSSISTRVVEVI